jgi:hypothetical protein
MHDLDILIPQAVELLIGGETLAIKPLKVGQMPAFLRAISPVMSHLTGSEINWLVMFGEHGEDLLSAIGIAVGKPRQWIDELAADEAILLAAKVIDAVQRLIEHGHRFPHILDYTLGQVRGFLAACERSDAARDARLLSLVAIGTRGDARNLDQALDRLTDRAHPA